MVEFDEGKLNNILKFIGVLYENADEYFYTSDMKILLDIILRELEMNRSELNQFLLLYLLGIFADKHWWKSLRHRVEDIRGMAI